MGSKYIEKTKSACSGEELHSWFDSLISEAQAEFGYNGYSGELNTKAGEGLIVSAKCFPDIESAREHTSDEADKSGPAIAVKVKKLSAGTHKKVASIQKKIDALYKSYPGCFSFRSKEESDVYDKALARSKSAKSKVKGCTVCGSQIARQYIRSINCPICSDNSFLLTQADFKKIATIKKRQQAAQEKEQRYKLDIDTAVKSDKSDNYIWYVGASCPS